MRIGTDYYPEHWEKERWSTDLSLMHEAGIQVVRIGEFDWALYEPRENEYHFAWMDDILDFMAAHDMKVVLGTPSATPPKWMADKYGEELYQTDIHGNPKIFGTRKHYCFNSSMYREKNRILVEKIAERYGSHPALEGWQIDNELGWANTTRCYCSKCRKKFQEYLKEKYQTIDCLNETYGTVFWSQTYNSFEEVIIPQAGACYDSCHDTQGQNPSLLLDFYRFSSDSVISFMNEQAEIIRRYSSLPVTTNMLDAAVNSGTGIDYFKMSKELDYVTWDNYIEFQWGIAEDAAVSRDHALLRSYKHQPFWVMEEQAGPCGWSKLGPAPSPGKLRLWTYQAVAGGADTVVYFRWRSCLFGTEEYWHGILGHDGKVNRRYEEIKKTGLEMKRLSSIFGKLMPRVQVAIVKSFDSEWSHSIHRHVEGFEYDRLLLDYYRSFYELGIPVDFVAPEEDLSAYKLVLAPALLMVNEEQKQNLTRYAQQGGNLLFTFRSGIKTMDNTMLPETVPGMFSDLAGIKVPDYDPQFQKQTTVSGVFGQSTASLWCDIIEPEQADVLGVYTGDYYAGSPCFTRNSCGMGSVYYMGCDLEQASMKNLAAYFCTALELCRPAYVQDKVERVSVTDGRKNAEFLLNHNGCAVVVPVERECTDFLTGRKIRKEIRLDPWDVALLG